MPDRTPPMPTRSRSKSTPTYDRDDVRDAARGRWGEILSSLAGLPAEVLDGRHHRCPLVAAEAIASTPTARLSI